MTFRGCGWVCHAPRTLLVILRNLKKGPDTRLFAARILFTMPIFRLLTVSVLIV